MEGFSARWGGGEEGGVISLSEQSKYGEEI